MTAARLKELFLKNTSTRQTFVKNTFWLSMGEVGSRILRAIVVIYAARVLGAAGYGAFSYLVGLAGFFTIFADIGVRQIMIRSVSQHPDKADAYFATAFWLKVALLVVTSLIVIFVAPQFSKIPEAAALLPLVALLTIFDNVREFSAGYFRGRERMQFETLLTFSTNIAIMLFGFIILFAAPTVTAFTLTYVLAAGVGTVLGIVLLRREFAKVIAAFNPALIMPILRAAWPVALLGSLGAFMLNTDVVVLNFYRTAAEIGYYAADQKIVQLLYIIPTIIAAGAFPVFSRFVQEERPRIRALFEKVVRITFLLALPIVVGGLVLAPSIIRFLYGSSYLPATSAFRLLLLTPLILFPGVIMSNFLLARNEQKRIAPFVIGTSVGNILFDMLLIPPYGIAGSAVATLLAQLIYNGGVYLTMRRLMPFSLTARLSIPVSSVVFMGISAIALQFFDVNVVANVIISLAIYIGLLYLLGEDLVDEFKKVFTRRSTEHTTEKA